jgi:hypothetical protein
MKKDTNIADDNLVMGVFLVTVIFMTIWSALMISDIKRDVKEIKITVDDMRQTYSEMLRPQTDTDISAKSHD